MELAYTKVFMWSAMSLKRSSTYCKRSLRSGSLRDTAQAARTTCHSRLRASSSNTKSGRLFELVTMSRISGRPQTVSACLQRSKIWLMVLAAGRKSQPLCGVDTAAGVMHGGEIVKGSSGCRSRSGWRRVTRALVLSRSPIQ